MASISIAMLLKPEQQLLDDIFGADQYRIASDHPHEAVVQSRRLEWQLGYDIRDGSIATLVTIATAGGQEAIPEVWAKFMGEEIAPLPRASTGHVAVEPVKQIHDAIILLARLNTELFSGEQTARDAVHFVRGYTLAYNEWASGAWRSLD